LGVPLSTVQRRRTRLERSVLRKRYELDVRALGWRNAEILMLVDKGKTNDIVQDLVSKFDKVVSTSIRVNTKSNLAVLVSFRNSEELHALIEAFRTIPEVTNLEWSEIVEDSDEKDLRLANLIFNSSKRVIF
jgi:DNA-binding Lrp family transcriptional regulator